MDQRTIVVFLHLKGFSAKAKDIHAEILHILGSDAITYSTVTKDMRNYLILENEPEVEDRAEDQYFSMTDNAIMEAVEMMSFASIRQVAKMTFISPTTGFRRLTKSLHFVLDRLRWVLHRLSNLPKQARVIMSMELLNLLEYM
jgi:hypothetical protein